MLKQSAEVISRSALTAGSCNLWPKDLTEHTEDRVTVIGIQPELWNELLHLLTDT